MKSHGLVLVPPDPRRHRRAVFDLTAKCSSGQGYWNWIDGCRRGYIDGSHYDWSASTIGLLGRRVVTHWGVIAAYLAKTLDVDFDHIFQRVRVDNCGISKISYENEKAIIQCINDTRHLS